MIFAHTCPHCGYTWTPTLTQVADVIVVSCMECMGHIRYCDIDDLPDLEDIKVAIFQAVYGDLSIINVAKKCIEFKPCQYADFAQVKYLRLYNAVFFVKKVKYDFERITNCITFV